MPDDRPSDVLGALPRRRPQRRSDKRRSREPVQPKTPTAANRSAVGTATAERPPARRATTARPKPPKRNAPRHGTHAAASLPAPVRATPRRRTQPLRQPAQPSGTPPTPHGRPPDQPTGRHILGTAAQAAAELAGIGLSLSARAVRNAVDRLPRP